MGRYSTKSVKEKDWPQEALDMYEKIDILGRGSFGFVWMARRKVPPAGDFDDEFVACKNIAIKDDKGKLYAQREISILQELNHPNIIKFIREFPFPGGRLIAIQLVRGGDLHNIVKMGALGLPLARLVTRQLIVAVGYIHGRAVIHRDIKPGNCILENTRLGPHDHYDWMHDENIWSDGEEAVKEVNSGKWKLMLIDFGFARALRSSEIHSQSRKMRNSILNEAKPNDRLYSTELKDAIIEEEDSADIENIENGSKSENDDDGDDENKSQDDSIEADIAAAARAAASLRRTSIRVEDLTDSFANLADMAASQEEVTTTRRSSTAKRKMRSMSALGTRAYAAPEIKKKLRRKTKDDLDKADAALTECVADYGMSVDAYSVGWTLRVLLTGVPPNITISDFMQKLEDEEDSLEDFDGALCCCGGEIAEQHKSLRDRVRDATELPDDATLLIDAMTKSEPEERMTVREAQNHPYVRGKQGEELYVPPAGDYPSMTGDPVVPLKCADELSKLVETYHQTEEKTPAS